VALPHPVCAAPPAEPAGSLLVHRGDRNSQTRRLVLDDRADCPPWPETERLSPGFPPDARPGGRAKAAPIRADEERGGRRPAEGNDGRLLGEGGGAVVLPAARLFAHAADASRVRALCRAGCTFGVHRAQGGDLVQVDVDRDTSPGLEDLHGAEELPIALDGGHTVALEKSTGMRSPWGRSSAVSGGAGFPPCGWSRWPGWHGGTPVRQSGGLPHRRCHGRDCAPPPTGRRHGLPRPGRPARRRALTGGDGHSLPCVPRHLFPSPPLPADPRKAAGQRQTRTGLRQRLSE